MAYINSERKTELESDLVSVKAQLAAIEAVFLSGNVGTDSYSFDSGTGRQQETFVSPMELLKTQGILIARRDRISRILRGASVTRYSKRRY